MPLDIPFILLRELDVKDFEFSHHGACFHWTEVRGCRIHGFRSICPISNIPWMSSSTERYKLL